MIARPMMTDEEIAFLESGLRPNHRVWEWGSGGSTLWLASRVKHVTAVEHQPAFAAALISEAPSNVSVLYYPPEFPYEEGTEDDGDLETFRSYVCCYTGELIDVVIIDGRSRLYCARHAAENAHFGPHPEMSFYLHDADRPQYRRIWEDDEKLWGESWFKPVERIGNLVRMEARL